MTIWACLCAGDILLTADGLLPRGTQPPLTLREWQCVTTLSLGTTRLHVVRLDHPVVGVAGLRMMPLRASFDVLPAADYAMAGKAAELIYWDANTRYCGCCGSPMRMDTPISKRCTACGKEVWPQLATAVIVRITRGRHDEEVLLARGRSFRGRYYGLVAGFVETGETLEDAVCREVREETGIAIDSLCYFGSQPWPYPCGLMVGFTARYAGGQLRVQREELADAIWCDRAHLPELPGRASIARRLIDDWLMAATPPRA